MSYLQHDPIVLSDRDAALARQAQLAFETNVVSDRDLHLQVTTPGQKPVTVDLPSSVARLLIDLLKEAAAGKGISLVSIETELSTHQAATMLNVSLSFLIELIEKGDLPARRVGTQPRVLLRDVLAYKAAHFARRSHVLDELVAEDQSSGLL